MKKILFAFFLLPLMFFAQNWDFRDGDLHGFRVDNYISYELKQGKGFLGVGESNAYFSTPWETELQAEDYKFLEVGLIAEEATLTVYFAGKEQPMSEKTRYDGTIDTQRNRVIIDLTKNPAWKGTVTSLRFDVVRSAGRKGNVQYIRLYSEKPFEVDNGIIPNGDFSAYQECWTGNAEFAPGRTVIPPKGAICSEPFEMLIIGKYIWLLQADGALSTTLEYLDILGNSIGKEASSTDSYGAVRPPRNAASVMVHIANESDVPVTLRRVAFNSLPGDLTAEEAAPIVEQGKSILSMPEFSNEFQGEWLWLEELGEKENTRAVFHKTFEIEDLNSIRQAKFHITADNEWKAALNGNNIEGSNGDVWSLADSAFVRKFLRQGKNTLNIIVDNTDGPGGVLADLILVHSDGKRVLISTDSDWKGSALTWNEKPSPGTLTVIGKNGVAPWGKISHGEPSDLTARLESSEMPAEFDENSIWAPVMKLYFKGEGSLNDDLDFSVRFKNDKNDFLILETLIPAGSTDESPVVDLNLAPAIFRYIPAGEYSVVFNLNGIPLDAPKGRKVTVQRKSPLVGLPSARIVNRDTVPHIQLDGKEKAPITQYLVDLGMSDRHYREMKQAFDQGVPAEWIHHVVEFDENGDPDFTNIDNMCTSVLARNPNIQFVLITALDCVRNMTMTKFFQDNPDALVKNHEGESAVRNYSDIRQLSPSFASEKWLAEGDRILTLLIKHLREMPYGQRVVGVLPSSGITWEWMYWGSQREGEFLDYSLAFRKAFAAFAREKYGTIENANLAWGKEFKSFEQIVEDNLLPTPTERMEQGNPLSLRLPKNDQYLMDFNRCMAVVTSDAIIHFCKTVKRVSEGKLLSGAYYGYYNQIVHSRWAQHCGHWALSRVLASDAVDLLHAPTTYNNRGPGGAGGFMIPDSSAHLAGKVFVTESDIRTIYSGQPQFGMCNTLGETAAVFIREAASCLSHNVALRYYDFSNGWVFRDPRYCELVGKISRAEREVIEASPNIDDPANAIAVVVSENSMEHLTYRSPLNIQGITNQYPHLARTGMSFDSYFTPGLEKIPLEHKMWFFENPFKLSAEDLAYIQEKILVPGNTVVFAMGVDVIQKNGFSVENMQALTGMEFVTEFKHPLEEPATLTDLGRRLLGPTTVAKYEPLVPTVPLFFPQEEGNTKIMARDKAGRPVMAENTVNGCRVVFTSIPCLNASWLRSLARQTGLHCYNATDGDVTWASGDILGIHCTVAGSRILQTPMTTGVAKELLTGKEYSIQNGSFSYEAPRMSSALFLLSNKEISLE